MVSVFLSVMQWLTELGHSEAAWSVEGSCELGLFPSSVFGVCNVSKRVSPSRLLFPCL